MTSLVLARTLPPSDRPNQNDCVVTSASGDFARASTGWTPFDLTPEDGGLQSVREARGHCFRVGTRAQYVGHPAVNQGGSDGRIDVLQNEILKTVDYSVLVLS